MRVLIFGDSITQGYWDTNGGWVERLRSHYDTRQIADLKNRDEPTIFNLGVSADNSQNILRRITAETTARTRHNKLPVVIVQIGINDSSTNSNGQGVGISLETYKHNLAAIINNIKPLSSQLVFVGLSACDEAKTTPVSWGDFHYTNTSIKQYEDAMQRIAAEHSITFIPVFDAFLKALQDSKNILPDGLHPNNEGHEVMFRIIAPQIASLLER